MSTRQYGFEPITGIEDRIEAFLDSLTPEQLTAFEALKGTIETYFYDARQFMDNAVDFEYGNRNVSVNQRKKNIAMAANDVMLRAITKFMLAAGEILTTGTTGPVSPETERLIDIDAL